MPSRVPYTERDVPVSAKVLRYAQRLVEQYDTNHDGQLEKAEWQKMRGNPAIVDRDHDGLITVDDLARYITIYGRYRHIQLLAPALVTNPPQPSGEGAAAPAADNSRGYNPTGRNASSESSPWGAADASAAAKSFSQIRRRNVDRAGNVESPNGLGGGAPPAVEEPSSTPPASTTLAAPPTDGAASTTTTGSQPLTPAPPATPAVSRTAAAGQRFFVPPMRLPQGVPPWFVTRDLDGDGQLTLSEFAPHPTQADIEEFNRYDSNHDGVITIDEVLHFGKPAAKVIGKAEGAKGKE
jgi:hypothetical protein